MGIADPSKRLEAMPPYKFQELEQQIADKRASGIDVISLGIGDPDEPTFDYVVKAMQAAVADPANHKYPNRGRDEFRPPSPSSTAAASEWRSTCRPR